MVYCGNILPDKTHVTSQFPMHTLEMRFLTIFLVHVLSAVQIVSGGLNSTLRSGRIYNPIVQLVNFPNDPCTGASTR